jgi:hypothetical protein
MPSRDLSVPRNRNVGLNVAPDDVHAPRLEIGAVPLLRIRAFEEELHANK